jgi:hypothetical protein
MDVFSLGQNDALTNPCFITGAIIVKKSAWATVSSGVGRPLIQVDVTIIEYVLAIIVFPSSVFIHYLPRPALLVGGFLPCGG